MTDEREDVDAATSAAAGPGEPGPLTGDAGGPPTGRVATTVLAAFTAAMDATGDPPGAAPTWRPAPGAPVVLSDDDEVYGPDHPVVAGAPGVATGARHRPRLGRRAGPATWLLGGAVAGLLAAGAASAALVHPSPAFATVRVHGGAGSLFPDGRSSDSGPNGPAPSMLLPAADAASAVLPALDPVTPTVATTPAAATTPTSVPPTTRSTTAPTKATAAPTTRPAAPTTTAAPRPTTPVASPAPAASTTTTSTTAPGSPSTTACPTTTSSVPPCTNPLCGVCVTPPTS
jgi:hypothetical protein